MVSRDLQFFLHGHPAWEGGAFRYSMTFPRPGMYRILGDFYPEAATPQLLPKTVFVEGPEAPVAPLTRDYSQKRTENLTVDFSISPADPTAGAPVQMRFTLNPADGLEKYLGAWGHMLAASDDLIDMIHTHPFIADGREVMQFNLVFPRAPLPHLGAISAERRGEYRPLRRPRQSRSSGTPTDCYAEAASGPRRPPTAAPPAPDVFTDHEQARRHEQHVQARRDHPADARRGDRLHDFHPGAGDEHHRKERQNGDRHGHQFRPQAGGGSLDDGVDVRSDPLAR